MKKERRKDKKGCWWRTLMIFLMMLLATAAVLLFSYLNSRNQVDEQFQNLVNRAFDGASFTDEVSGYKASFASNLRSATGNNSVCNDDGVIDFNILLGDDSKLSKDWVLNKDDLAIYCSQRNALTAISNDNLDLVLGIMTINRIEWTISGQQVEYAMVYEIKGSALANRVSLNETPKSMYVVARVTIDLILGNPVKMYNYTVNKLSADESEYCLKKLFGESSYTEKLQTELAYRPFTYLSELKKLWGGRITLVDDGIKLAK